MTLQGAFAIRGDFGRGMWEWFKRLGERVWLAFADGCDRFGACVCREAGGDLTSARWAPVRHTYVRRVL